MLKLDELLFEQFFRRQVELVFFGVDIRLGWKCQFDDGFVLALAEQDADGRILFGQIFVPIEVVHIHLHLTEILVRELVELQIDQHIAA